jgi:hypothetical protein
MKNLNIKMIAENSISPAMEVRFKEIATEIMNEREEAKRSFVENFERDKFMFVLAVVAGTKKRVKRVLPKHNLKIKVTTASPLNEFVANISFTYKGRTKYFDKMDLIWAGLLDNDNYPSIPVARTVWDAQKLIYDNARSAKQTLVADQAFANMIYISKQNGIYVANTCGNDLIVFNTSGYTANKTSKSPVQDMGKAVIRGAKDTKYSGEVKIEIEEMPGAQNYECYYQLVVAPLGPLIFSCSGPKLNPTLKGLPRVDINIYTRAVGPKGPGNMSDPKPYTPR